MPGYDDPDDYDEEILTVVNKVLNSFRQSATAEDIAALGRARPSIPREVDRALLVDMSDILEVSDLNERIRFRLREKFWEQYG